MNQPDEFPPTAHHSKEVDLVVESFAAVVAGRIAWYVSSPLTSGERSEEWRSRNPESSVHSVGVSEERFEREVLGRNRDDAAKYVEGLRTRTRGVVINPTALGNMPDWSQSDYRVLWARVIERYVATIVFRDGWQHSNGCAWEFLTGYLANRTLLQEDLNTLDFHEGRLLLTTAASASGGSPTSAFQAAVLAALGGHLAPEWRDPR